MSLLTVRQLVAGYGVAPPVLQGLDLTVGQGELVALLGPNGVGKTTLLKVVSGLLPPRAGEVLIGDRVVRREGPEARLGLGVALVPEGRRLFGSLSVRDNLRAGALTAGKNADIDGVLALFPRLSERMEVRAGSLSGGEQQMLAVARAVLAKPRVLLIDEPSLGLAPLMSRAVFEALRALAEGGTGVLLAEQNLRLALSVADRAIVLDGGQSVGEEECRTEEGRQRISDVYQAVTQLGAAAG